MISLSVDRARRILVVRFEDDLSRDGLNRLDVLLAALVEREGTFDTIIDFTGTRPGPIQTRPIVERAMSKSRMPGRTRIFVANSEVQFGLFRLYGAYQEGRGNSAPHVVRSLAEALAALRGEDAAFEVVTLDESLVSRTV